MNESVSHADHFRPCHFGMIGLNLLRDTIGGFSNDLYQTRQRQIEG